MAGTVSLHRHGDQSGGGWKGKSFPQAARRSKMAVTDKTCQSWRMALSQPTMKC